MNLTRREKEVLTKLTEGFTVKEVARFLFVAPSTIETHKQKIYKKFEARTLTQLGAMAVRSGIIAILTLFIFLPGISQSEFEIDGTIKATGLIGNGNRTVVADDDGLLKIVAQDPAIWELKDSTGDIRFRFDANKGLFQQLLKGDTIRETQILEPAQPSNFRSKKPSVRKAITKEGALLFAERVVDKVESTQDKLIANGFPEIPLPLLVPDPTYVAIDKVVNLGIFEIHFGDDNDPIQDFDGVIDENGKIVAITIIDHITGDYWEISFVENNIKSIYHVNSDGAETDKTFDANCEVIRGDHDGETSFSFLNKPEEMTQTGHDGRDIFSYGPDGASTWFRHIGLGVVPFPGGTQSFVNNDGVGQVGDDSEPSTFGLLSKNQLTFGKGEGGDHKQVAIQAMPEDTTIVICSNVVIKGNLVVQGEIINVPPFERPIPKAFNKWPNIFTTSGKIRTDDQGKAQVKLEKYLSENFTDHTYQLTIIGSFARAIISKEVKNGSFEITSDHPNVKVSWQISAVRKPHIIKKISKGYSELTQPVPVEISRIPSPVVPGQQ